MPMIVGDGSHTKEITAYIKRVNRLNGSNLLWRWNAKSAIAQGRPNEPEVEVYEGEDVLCITLPEQVIETMKRWMSEWSLEDPDE